MLVGKAGSGVAQQSRGKDSVKIMLTSDVVDVYKSGGLGNGTLFKHKALRLSILAPT